MRSWFLAVTLCGLLCTRAFAGETVLYKFKGGADGYGPIGGLVSDQNGNLYGVTNQGGTHALGTVFELSPDGGGIWKKTIIHSFNGAADGQFPEAGLIIDAAGNLYGTTAGGFSNCAPNCGSVFELSPGAGVWKLTALHTFRGGKDGGILLGGVVMDSRGNVYGTTATFGLNSGATTFRLSPSGGTWVLTTLHAFSSGTSGEGPRGSLVLDSDGSIYGTTEFGGTPIQGQAYGVFYRLSLSGSGKWIEKVLYSFRGAGDGGNPTYGLVEDESGNFYGVSTLLPRRRGCVFQFAPKSTNIWKKTNIYAFPFPKYRGPDLPLGSLTFDQAGNLYGVAGGGAARVGTVYQLTPERGTRWTETTLYSFQGGMDGVSPNGQLLRDSSGNKYGVTVEGGGTGCGAGCGTIFSIAP